MRSIFVVLSACGAVSHASECQAADEASLLQSRVVHAHHKGKKAWLQTLRDVAESLTEGSGTTKTADEVQDALSAAGEALAQLSPAIRNQIEAAQQQVDHASSAVQACHAEAAATRRAGLQVQVDQRAAAVESCEADLQAAIAAEEVACTRAEDCLCDEARAHRTDQAALCAAVTDTYETAFCEHRMACTVFHECHADEMQVYNSLRADVEQQMAALEQEYIATEQASCLTALIMEAMTPPITPIPHAALIACDDVDVSVLHINMPQLPSEPAACPQADVQCGQCVPLLTDYALGNRNNAPARAPESVGSFSYIRAVHKSGRVTCQRTRNPGSNYVWQQCCPGPYGTCTAAFELIQNGNLIIEQGNANSGCVQPSTPDGDVVCHLPVDVSSNDNFIVTWAETRTQYTIGDNEVDLVVDVFGCN